MDDSNKPLESESQQRRPDPVATDLVRLRNRAELQVLSMGTMRNLALSPKELIHELQVHQVELETQNQELKRAQDEIELSRSRYFDLFDLAPIGYILFDEKGIVHEANFAAAALLGVMKNALIGKPLDLWVAPESVASFYSLIKGLTAADPQGCEILMRRSDGSTFWSRLQTTVMPDVEIRSASYRVAIIDITSIKHAEEITKGAAVNETLLLELQHRVKNTLAQILAFVRIQADMTTNVDVKNALGDLERRVDVLSNLYTMLYASHNHRAARLDEYLREVAWALVTALDKRAGSIELKLDLDEITADARTASCFGLIENELITNALKHSFPNGRAGLITVLLKKDGSVIRLEVIDDGIEFPAEFSLESGSGFGHLIIMSLAMQLGGEVFFDRAPIKRIGIVVDLKVGAYKDERTSPLDVL